MINALVGLVGLYIIYRVATGIIIPRYYNYKIRKYKEEIENSNPELLKNKDKLYTGKVHPSIRKYYKDEDIEKEDDLKYMEKFKTKENNKK